MSFSKILFRSFLVLVPFFGQTQNIEGLNQNPPSIKWKELNTPHFRLIFPESYAAQSQNVANILETTYLPVSKSLGVKPRKYPIILQNQTTISNGFVEPINHRSEFFTTPPQSPVGGSLNWIEGLAIHEFRHIAQFEKTLGNRKNRFMNTILGDFGLGLPHLFIPNWFYEGDAVGTETALTQSGRGRVPEFDVLLRSQLLTQKPFRYSKAMNGSYQDNVPNHYVTGYFLTSYLKNNYGADVWDKILTKTFNHFLFARSIRKVTGLKINKLYTNAMQDASKRWQTRFDENKSSQANNIYAPKNRFYTSYLYPQLLDNGAVVALNTGLGDIPQLVLMGSETEKSIEKPLHKLGNWNDSDKLSLANNQILWTEFELDPRWGMRNYSVLKVFDMNTNEVKTLTHKTRYFAPAFSPDAQQIVAVEFSEEGNNSLVILNKEGQKIKTFENPENDFFQHPVFTADGKNIIYIRQNKTGKRIEMMEIANEKADQISNYTHENIVTPVDFGNFIVFTAPQQGTENLFAINKQSKEQYQVTNSKFGAYYPSVNAKSQRIFYNEQTPKGRSIAEANADPKTWKLLENGFKIDEQVQFFGKFMQQEQQNIFANLPKEKYEVKPFKKLNNMLHIYGWGPAVSGSDVSSPSLGIASRDLLSTTDFNTGVSYNMAENAPSYFANLSYKALFPVINLSYENGRRNSTVPVEMGTQKDQWRYQTIETGISIPLQLTHSKYNEIFNVSANLSHNIVSDYDLPKRSVSTLPNGTFRAMRYDLIYSKTLKRSTLNVGSRAGFEVVASYRHTPFSGSLQAEQLGAYTHLYLPGLAKFHSIRLRAGLQRSASAYQFTTAIPFVRGESYTLFNQLNVASIDYRFPIFYPDWSFGRIGTIKRFKGILWADTGVGKIKTKSFNFNTVGFDLTANLGITNLLPEMELGIRTIYNPVIKEFSFQPLVLNLGF